MIAIVAIAAAAGACARDALDSVISHRTASAFPYGTFVVNVTGSFALAVIAGLALHHGLAPRVQTVAGTGFLGAYTTFSTFAYETVFLARAGRTPAAVANATLSVAAGLLAAAAGLALT
jgi:fluoride exporter